MALPTLPDSAAAESDGLELTITAHGSRLEIALANRSDETLQVYFAADGPTARHFDFLTTSLEDGGGARLLRFTGNRNRSSLGLVELKAGEKVADELDLAAWAMEPVNGGVSLDPGEYALTATYRVAQAEAWSGSITAGPIRVVAG